MRRIPSEGLEAELWLLMAHKWGIEGANSLDLPLLQANPLVRSKMVEKFSFEQALRSVLLDLLDDLEPQSMAEALGWELAVADGSGGHLPRERFLEARKRSKLGKVQYSQDRQGPVPGRLLRESRRTQAVKQLVSRLEEGGQPQGSESETGTSPENQMSLTQSPRCIHIGRLNIDHAISIASCDKQQGSTHELLLEFETALRPSRPEPDEWPLLNAQLLPVLEEEARKAIVKFENDPILDLVYVEHRPETAAGAQRYKIGVAESLYYHWAGTANSLDRNLSNFPDVTGQLGHPKLREAWRCDPSSLGDLTRLPAPAFIGVCVVVIAEGKIILLERRREHHVANTADGIPTHFMGAGMLPKDVDAGRYSPEQAARRGCREELGIGHTHLTLIPTGLIIDTKRWQPLFCFVGECDLTIPRLEVCMKKAPHKYETGFGKIAASLPWTVQGDQTLAVLAGEDPTFSLASNHAQAALLNALYYADGQEAVHKRLGA
jgi:hypothetical protein